MQIHRDINVIGWAVVISWVFLIGCSQGPSSGVPADTIYHGGRIYTVWQDVPVTEISKDYLTCPDDEIKDIEAVTTILGGKVVFQR